MHSIDTAGRGPQVHPRGTQEIEPTSQPPVLCLHCSTGSSRQWRSLSAYLGEKRRVIAPDLLGYGDNPPWPRQRGLRLETESRRLHHLLDAVPGPVDVVAHSFGGAVAIKLALAKPDKIRSLSLYEPVMFALLRGEADADPALRQIFSASELIGRAFMSGRTDAACRHFIDFWSGEGSWTSMPEPRREAVRTRIAKVRADFAALLADQTTLSMLRQLDMPVLSMSGEQSPLATRRIAGILASALPRAIHKRFAHAGHMGPITHAGQINARIGAFLAAPPRTRSRRLPPIAFAAHAA